MAYDLIQVGTGGQGAWWCEKFLPPNVEAGRVNVVAAVDVDEEAHESAQEALGVAPENCYTDAAAAFEAHPEADFCSVVVPPWSTRTSSTWRSNTTVTSSPRSPSPTRSRRRFASPRRSSARGRRWA